MRGLTSCVLPLVTFVSACSQATDCDQFPYGTKENAKLAAEECGIKTWYWGKAIPMHGPAPERPSFAFDAEPNSDGVTTKAALIKIYDCLDASFTRQKVRIDLAGAV